MGRLALDPAQRSNKFLNAVESSRPFGHNAVIDVLARQGPYVGSSEVLIRRLKQSNLAPRLAQMVERLLGLVLSMASLLQMSD
jgi:hypothetical protein